MADIFISYARKDRTTAQRLAGALETRGWSVWWDPRLKADEFPGDSRRTGPALERGNKVSLYFSQVYAGSRALLVSNWPVHSASAKDLTTDLFRRQAEDSGLDRAEALRRAMVGLIDGDGYVDAQSRTVFSYAHPLFWAPFTLVGDGGGRPTS
jgi:hypothetical protein